MRTIVLLTLVCVAAFAKISWALYYQDDDWVRYKHQFNKVYETPEEDKRRHLRYLESKMMVTKHNLAGNSTCTLALNHLSDWFEDELSTLRGIPEELPLPKVADFQLSRKFMEAIHRDERPVPDELDWRTVPNVVGPVKNQLKCGSCWAFATTGLLEGQQVKNRFTTKLVPLSEQQLVDCSGKTRCKRGWYPVEALKDIIKMGGIMSEKEYSYLGYSPGICRTEPDEFIMSVTSAIELVSLDEVTMKKVLSIYGPFAFYYNVGPSFVWHKEGVFDENDCKEIAAHAMLLVGYGSDPIEGDFWIVKNSWGSNWGEQGYIKIKRGVNLCWIGDRSVVATFD